MGSKRLSWISLVLSIIALVVGVIALVNRCPTLDLYSHFDYMGVIVGILALLVTALIGAQVGQYVFVDRKIEKIAGKISRIISRKVAAEVAHRETPDLARTAASEAIDVIVSDFSLIMKGQDLLYKAKNEAMFAEYMSAIDNAFEAISVYVQCRNDKMSAPSITDSLDYLSRVCEESKEHGGARVLEGRKHYYESILDKLKQDVTPIKNYLAEATEMPADTDEKIREEDINSIFKV